MKQPFPLILGNLIFDHSRNFKARLTYKNKFNHLNNFFITQVPATIHHGIQWKDYEKIFKEMEKESTPIRPKASPISNGGFSKDYSILWMFLCFILGLVFGILFKS